jgi:hypothetical protein
MKIEPIDYSASYESVNEYGLKRWEKIGIGATITENDDPIQCLQELKNKVEQFHRESNKTLSIVADNVPVLEVQVVKTPKQSMIEAITTCTEVATLKTFEKLAKSKPEFQQAYDETMIKLTK